MLTAIATDDRALALRRVMAQQARQAVDAHHEISTHDLLDGLAELTLAAQAAAGRRWGQAA
ncbi:hypothetical protein SAMN05661080_03758 [Modestobacter sp. DSM 44400]|uniref:hypothetical protein n=1 Tax=Modestobacter sp. DSM 44400 TaxID=1550230 RepID=UPI00089AD0B0|nr:hypothetical protein [Modestobacter sp. DSM 44400]SDY52824.1 hypothetical protein SAMN05661080_03758 [Modestobacter sp. DSM 44400]